MRFGKTLKTSIYAPWEDHYLDYHKLKRLLREHETTSSEEGGEGEGTAWTEEDEENFVQELVNVQLDKVNSFQVDTYRQLRDRTADCEAKLEPLTVEDETATVKDPDQRRTIAEDTLNELDKITREVSELEKYSRINFTGFLKAAKKHDRKRGARYRVRPLLQVRLSQLPFNSEDYSPVLYRLSAMYSFVRQILEQQNAPQPERGPSVDTLLGNDVYTSRKFWVHADNILEVKAFILRQLPVLVYNPNTSKELQLGQRDPTITSLYFDSRKFDMYSKKVARTPGAGSLRLRWTGKLNERPEIFLEKKTVGEGDSSREVRIRVKEKHVQSFLKGDYKMEKILHRMETQDNSEPERAVSLRQDIEEIQSFIREDQLQPMVRATYTRAAFQIPGDDRIRISLDTDLALIREDTLDPEHLCRDPDSWHRHDIDNQEIEFPFSQVSDDEISRFPYALLDIKIRGNGNRAHNEWISDLMSSHLVKEAPRFSKFVHGVAELFEDHVNSFPFWLSEMETDIRRDPEMAFQEEQEKKAQRAEDEMAVGSFLGHHHGSGTPQKAVGSPVSRKTSHDSVPPQRRPSRPQMAAVPESRETGPSSPANRAAGTAPAASSASPAPTGLQSLLPKFSMSRYARAHSQAPAALPPGIYHPGTWIKDSGPVRVEAKVWLANQRTFIKWQHICVLLATLSLGLYNAAGKDNPVASALAIVYTCFAIFAGAWGWGMYVWRSRLIRERSGKDFDNVFGPLVICVGLAVALVLNFWFKYAASTSKPEPSNPTSTGPSNPTFHFSPSATEVFKLVDQAGGT